jgi:hypothetical protein
MLRLVGVVVVVMLAVVPSAQAAIGIRVDQKVVVVGASLHVTAFGPAGAAGMPVYLAPASIDFTPRQCDGNSLCFPTSDGPPSAPYVRIGHLPQSIDVFHTRRMSFRVPAVRTGAYRVVVYCEPCVAGTAGSLIASQQTVRIARRLR